MGEGLLLKVDVGVEHGAFGFSGGVYAEEVCESEVFAAYPVLVEEAGFVGGDEVAAVLDEGSDLVALGVAEGGDIGQDDGFIGGEMGGVEKLVVDHVEGDAGFDESLIPT